MCQATHSVEAARRDDGIRASAECGERVAQHRCVFRILPFREPRHLPMTPDKARHVGDIVAMIVADTLDRARDAVRGIEVTCIDNGMPVVVLAASSVGRTGHEPRDQLDKDTELKARLEEIRLAAGPLMNLGDVKNKVVPKMILVAEPRAGGSIATRSFIPHECHASIGVFAAVTIGTACVLDGSPAHSVAQLPDGLIKTISVEHPTGEFSVRLVLEKEGTGLRVVSAGLLRTARKLFDGRIFPRWDVAAKLK